MAIPVNIFDSDSESSWLVHMLCGGDWTLPRTAGDTEVVDWPDAFGQDAESVFKAGDAKLVCACGCPSASRNSS